MLRYALRNLLQNKIRLVISVGGVALALTLILALDAILTGVEGQLSAYIDHSGADVFVSQSGVRNLHMVSSSLPGSVDGLGIGDKVNILGQKLTIAGLSNGTANLLNSVAFISLNDFARLRGNMSMGNATSTSPTMPIISFVLVKVKPGVSPEAVATRIEQEVTGVTAQSRGAFATQERKIVKDMVTDLLTTMNLVGFLVGLAVMALTVYIATLSRRVEYGILKAVGARNRYLYGTVLALTITFLLSVIIPNLGSNLALQISSASLLKVGIVSLVIATLSALLPIRQIAGLDPALVFKGV